MDTLPNELIIDIFECATFVPDAFYSGPIDPFLVPPLHSLDDTQEALEHSLATKAVLVRICKRWRRLAFEILYKAVFVSDLDKARSLVETLQNSKGSVHGEYGYGWWTRRVDWAIRSASEDIDQSISIVADQLSEAIRYFPNLIIFSSVFDLSSFTSPYLYSFAMPSVLLSTLGEVCSGSLRSFGCVTRASQDDMIHLHPKDMITLLGAIPGLRVLSCQRVTGLLQHTTPMLRLFALSSLTYNHGLSFLCNDKEYLPRLRHLSLTKTFSNPNQFLLVHGDKLSTISFSGGMTFAHVMRDSSLQFRRLSGLYLTVPDWPRIYVGAGEVSLPPTVTSLGLQCSERIMHDYHYKCLFDWLSIIDGQSLKVVRFTCSWNISDMRTHPHTLARGLSSVAFRGIQVQDHEGRPLVEDGNL